MFLQTQCWPTRGIRHSVARMASDQWHTRRSADRVFNSSSRLEGGDLVPCSLSRDSLLALRVSADAGWPSPSPTVQSSPLSAQSGPALPAQIHAQPASQMKLG